MSLRLGYIVVRAGIPLAASRNKRNLNVLVKQSHASLFTSRDEANTAIVASMNYAVSRGERMQMLDSYQVIPVRRP